MPRASALCYRRKASANLGVIEMAVINLDKYEGLFKDPTSFQNFVSDFTSDLSSDLVPVIANHEVVGAIVSREATKDVLCARLVKKLSECPQILDEIKDRIENDEIVD
jgi:hypothetical protein